MQQKSGKLACMHQVTLFELLVTAVWTQLGHIRHRSDVIADVHFHILIGELVSWLPTKLQ